MHCGANGCAWTDKNSASAVMPDVPNSRSLGLFEPRECEGSRMARECALFKQHARRLALVQCGRDAIVCEYVGGHFAEYVVRREQSQNSGWKIGERTLGCKIS